MFLFRLGLGTDSVQVGYIGELFLLSLPPSSLHPTPSNHHKTFQAGMCASGKQASTTFNKDINTVLATFNTTADTDLGKLLVAGRGIQSQLPIFFVFPLAVLGLYILWALSLTYVLRLVSYGQPGGDPPPFQTIPRLRHRLEWVTWRWMAYLLGVPAAFVAIGASWATTTAMNALVSAWGNLGTALSDPAVAVVEKGITLEVAQWAAGLLAIVFGLHTGRLFIEARRLLGSKGFIQTAKVSSLDKGMVMGVAMGMGMAGGAPGMFPGTNLPMPPPPAMV
jgi:hypothetical protein